MEDEGQVMEFDTDVSINISFTEETTKMEVVGDGNCTAGHINLAIKCLVDTLLKHDFPPELILEDVVCFIEDSMEEPTE